MAPPSSWYRDNFLISTEKSLLQPAAINQAFGTDMLYWTREIDKDLMKKMLNNSMCFGLYELPSSSLDIAGRDSPRQIGLARLVTDEVSFVYLTDVYIIQEYQGKGLGRWLIECVNEVLSSWPELRATVLFSSDGRAQKFYEKNLGTKPLEQGKNGLVIMMNRGKGSPLDD